MEDVEIARNTKLKNIYEIAKILEIPEEDVEPLKQGITAYGQNELAKKLEDFE